MSARISRDIWEGNLGRMAWEGDGTGGWQAGREGEGLGTDPDPCLSPAGGAV